MMKRPIRAILYIFDEKIRLFKYVHLVSPFLSSTNPYAYKSRAFVIPAQIQMAAITLLRNLDVTRWAFIGKTTATSRSTAIQTRLHAETAYEVENKNFIALQKYPVVLPKGHRVELEDIFASLKGITDNGYTKSETAILTIKKFVVFLNSFLWCKITSMRAFPTKLDSIIVEKTRINTTFTETELSNVSHALPSCELIVALLKIPDMFKVWTVALNQKEDILVSIEKIKKGFLWFPTKCDLNLHFLSNGVPTKQISPRKSFLGKDCFV